MKSIISLIYIATLIFSPIPITSQIVNQSDEVVTITNEKQDITGDGLNETIELKGSLLTNNNNYYHDIWLEITASEHETWTIPYQGGYDPKVHFITLPHKKGKAIFFHSKQSEQDDFENNSLHMITNQGLSEINLPEHTYMSGSFQDEFAVHLSIDEQLEPTILSISQKKPYEDIYKQDGRLSKQTNFLIPDSGSLSPTYISSSKQYGLTGVQQAYDTTTEQIIGAVETLWYFEDEKWIKINEQWISMTKNNR